VWLARKTLNWNKYTINNVITVINIAMGLRAVDNSVGIALGYGLDDWSSTVLFPKGLEIFLFTTMFRTALGPIQPPIQWVSRALSLGAKRPGREVEHSLPSITEVKECVELYVYSPNTPSWCGAQLKNTGTTLLYLIYITLLSLHDILSITMYDKFRWNQYGNIVFLYLRLSPAVLTPTLVLPSTNAWSPLFFT
jgi:hypothetical protein